MTISAIPNDGLAVPASPRAAEILARLEQLGPMIEAQADEIDGLRQLTPGMREALRATGIFGATFPADWGGTEMSLNDQVRAVEILAYHDASVAWNTQILMDSGIYAAQLPRAAAQALYPDHQLATAGAFYPPARADRVEGGWRVTKGRWPFGSGIHSADRVVCGINLYENGEPLLDQEGQPEFRVAYVSKENVELLDTWYTVGMRGSGSTDYVVENAVIPDDHMFRYFAAGAKHLPPLCRYPNLIGVTLQGISIGIGRRILDEVRAALAKRPSNDRLVRIQFAEAVMNLEAARAYSYEVTRTLSQRLFADEDIAPEDVARETLASVNAGHQITRAVDMAMELMGASVIYNRSPLERRRRDLSVALVHIGHQRKALEVPGGLLLGESNLPRFA